MDKEELCKRKFKLWFYQVSHSEAIIRSPKIDLGKTYDTNIDIYVGAIDYIEIPTIMTELCISNATMEDVTYLTEKLGKNISTEKIIVLISEGRKYYIVASIIKILENDLDFVELPIYSFITNKEK